MDTRRLLRIVATTTIKSINNMAKKDIISKHVLKRLAADIANILLHLDIDNDSVELLSTEQQRIELRHADLVARVKQRNTQKSFILHVEIQNNNDKQMPLRMLRYFTDIQLAYPDERIHQYLVYIGKTVLNMPDYFKAGDFNYRYHILDMHTVDCQLLLAQDTPDALVLAILCDFKERPVQDVVNYIVKRLQQLLKDDESGFRNYFEMLETLSENRDLKSNIDEAKNMLSEIDIKKLPSYNWGLQQGLEQGRKQEAIDIAKQMLSFMDDEKIAKITKLPYETIKSLRNSKPH